MKRDAARSQGKAVASRRTPAKQLRAQPDKHPGTDAPKALKAPSRSVAMRLAAEVERLAAQLEQSRARISDLEARVDIDPLTELINRRGFERELKRSVALLWNVTGPAAAAKAAALERAIYSTPVHWGPSTLVVGASAGVALIGALDTPADVLARADAAMYARKAERRERLLGHSGSRAAAARNP
jgi:GGDEF domain-containing protein